MQALKKAERAKQSNLPDEELERPSEAFDDILALEPQSPAAPQAGTAGLSLEPLDASAYTSRSAAGMASATTDHAYEAATAPSEEPSLAPLDFTPSGSGEIPLVPATEAIHDPVPPQARQEAAPAAAAAPRTPPGQQTAQPAARRSGQTPRHSARPSHEKTAGRIDPAHLRLAILGGILALIVIIFGLMYWRALTARPGASLPMVAMPGQGGVPPATVVVPAAPAGDAAATPAVDGAAPQPPAPAYAAQPSPVEQRMSPEEAQAASRAATERQAAETHQPTQGVAPAPASNGAFHATAPSASSDSSAGLTPIGAESGELRIVRNSAAQQVPPLIQAAYQSFQAGDMAGAGQQYAQALQQDPNNRDALLGSAAVALREQRPAQASAAYLRLLELDPNDGEALAGLSSLRGGDAGQTEGRLKAILQRAPESAPVHFALGNLYARQGRWPEAQQAFFRAYTGSPSNPDYAFNLAIGLDRLNQGKLALGYYERALALAQATRASFDQAAALRRLQELAAAAR
ncbi:lipopolysaccharide assembly protein LapB [Massilia sp. BJB1822]|uniref:tetratricopeptide repeat protein n=1 Tax=Massilia sp. BJB1822 TaxID=2744470 RepID=UPI001594ACDE|nr:tetratricopeptide repeat protein [Massilia sp. BJB1822]NVD97503.1 tetratricopeptide repeat protein [Massilia sp. BJB1822]